MIKEHGLEIVRVWIYWSKVNPQEGKYHFEEYDEFFEIAEKNGLKVLAQLMLEGAPYWFQDKYPEALYMNREGRRVEFRAIEALAIGGFPGPCFDNTVNRDVGSEFITKTVSRYSGRESLYAWDVWNEIWRQWPCYCQSTQDAFRMWLCKKYGNIANLNNKWQRTYKDFSDVRMPTHGQYADMGDVFEFVQWQAAENMRWRVINVREIDKKHLIVAHHGHSCLEPYAWDDDWLLAEPLDVWGVSQYLRPPVGLWAADEHVVKSDYHRISFRFNTIRCSANGKPWWLSEHTGGRTWKFLGDHLRSESELRSSLMLAFSHGAEGAIYWQWRPECFGEEAPNFGLTNQDGEPTYRTQMVKNFCEAIRRNKTLLDNLKWEKSAVGIIWEPRSYILERISLWERKMEPLGPFNIFGYYMALIDSGYQVDILNARKIITEGIPSNIKVLISPYQIIDREGLSSRIEKWVRLGGTLLAGPLYATYAEDTYASEKVPPEDMRQILGIKQKEIYYEKEPQIKLIEEEEKCEKRILKGYKLVETYESSGARAAGFYKGEVALAQNAYGRGLAFTLGSFFGNAYANGIDKNLAILIDGICLRSGVRLELRASGNVFLRVASSGNKRIVFVHNPTFETSISHITIDKYEKEATVQNMITNEEIGVIGPEKPLELKIMPRDSLMLLIQ